MQFQLFSSAFTGSDLEEAVRSLLCGRASDAFLKFLSPNDLGVTGSHQAGLYLPREAAPLFLGERAFAKGENIDREVAIEFRGGSVRAMFHWWGRKKSECHLTRLLPIFGSDRARLVGSLLVLLPLQSEVDGLFLGLEALPRFQCWILERDEDIETLLDVLGITPVETNRLLRFDLNDRLLPECEAFARETGSGFPSGEDIAARSRKIYEGLYGALEEDADAMLLRLIEIEYSLFRYFEKALYSERLGKGFSTIEDFLALSLEIHNRRKSRAGQSLELHLDHVFQRFHVEFTRGATTRENRRPDFLFPSLDAYERFRHGEVGHQGSREVFFLAAKTTCKDRWRQILTEAPGIGTCYLFTLQQAISSAQLREMVEEGVQIVLPESYRKRFPEEDRSRTISLSDFIGLLREAGCQREDLFSSIRVRR